MKTQLKEQGMRKTSIAILALSLAVALILAACGGDDGNDDNVCEYDAVGELCQQAYDCCGQVKSWAIAEGHQEWEVLSCEPYICITMPEERCQDMLGQGVKVEDTYKVDFSDCS